LLLLLLVKSVKFDLYEYALYFETEGVAIPEV